MEELPILNYTGGLFDQLTVGDTANDRNMKIMDEICSAAAQEWNRQGLIQEKNPDPFLQIYLDELMAGIRNPQPSLAAGLNVHNRITNEKEDHQTLFKQFSSHWI